MTGSMFSLSMSSSKVVALRFVGEVRVDSAAVVGVRIDSEEEERVWRGRLITILAVLEIGEVLETGAVEGSEWLTDLSCHRAFLFPFFPFLSREMNLSMKSRIGIGVNTQMTESRINKSSCSVQFSSVQFVCFDAMLLLMSTFTTNLITTKAFSNGGEGRVY